MIFARPLTVGRGRSVVPRNGDMSENGETRSSDDGDSRGSLLAHLLLAAVLLELALHRLAVPGLRPVRVEPPGWHATLSWIANFAFYFAFVFAIVVLGRGLARAFTDRAARGHRASSIAHAITGAALIALSTAVVFAPRSELLIFILDAAFTLTLVVVIVAQVRPGGDLGARIGLVLLALPLVLHFYAPFALRFISGDDLGLPERVQVFGQWALVFSALATPYCFAPRPFTSSAARVLPFIVAMFVSLLSAIVIRRAGEVGMDLARDGLGVVLDPLAPMSMLALYIMALAAVAWTLVSCLAAVAPARRDIGVGIGLVLLGGYGFEWPLQYLLGFLGLLLIGSAARRVSGEERRPAHSSRVSQISDAKWSAFATALAEAIALDHSDESVPSKLTVADDDGLSRTHLVWTDRGHPVRVTFVRRDRQLASIEYLFGDSSAPGLAPAWTLWARAGSGDAGAHPSPPPCPAPASRLGVAGFDERFQMRDAADYGARMLGDQEMSQRASELLSGWLALWPKSGLRHRLVFGGSGHRLVTSLESLNDPNSWVEPFRDWLALLSAMTRNGIDENP